MTRRARPRTLRSRQEPWLRLPAPRAPRGRATGRPHQRSPVVRRGSEAHLSSQGAVRPGPRATENLSTKKKAGGRRTHLARLQEHLHLGAPIVRRDDSPVHRVERAVLHSPERGQISRGGQQWARTLGGDVRLLTGPVRQQAAGATRFRRACRPSRFVPPASQAAGPAPGPPQVEAGSCCCASCLC